MDISNPNPDTYMLWQVFTDPATGKKAVAISTTHAVIFISVYSTLIGMVMVVAWGLLVSLPIIFVMPRKRTRTTHIAAITAWSYSDPWSASVVLGTHTWQVFQGALMGRHPAELTWKAFWFDAALLAVALITALGGWALSTLFPILLTLGNIAPVNPWVVYLPLYSTYSDIIAQNRVDVEYTSMAALKAFGAVDNNDPRSQDPLVNLQSQPLSSTSGEDRYSIQYNYKVTGTNMGLQKLRDLTLEVSGNCSFQDRWWYEGQYLNEPGGGNTFYETYMIWDPATLAQYPDLEQTPYNFDTGTYGNNTAPIDVPTSPSSPPIANFYFPVYTRYLLNLETGRSYFVVIPVTAKKPTVGTSTDPWYATEIVNPSPLNTQYPNVVKTQRPPLLCQENNEWSFGDWKGKMKNLVSNGPDGPPASIPAGISSLLQVKLYYPVMASLGWALSTASLRSATRLIPKDLAIDTKTARAQDDMKRLVQASYFATRDIFRDAALAGSALKDDLSKGVLTNSLRDKDTAEPIPGTGDFVITSSAVQALNLSALIPVVCVLVLLTVVSLLLRVARERGKSSYTSDTGFKGRLNRYLLLVTGLHASRLYRMVDQLIAERAPSDFGGWDGESHKRQAQWKNQTGDFPFVVPQPDAIPGDPVILPLFHVQAKGEDRRLVLDVLRGESEGHWHSILPSDGKVRLGGVDRQAEQQRETTRHPEKRTQDHSDLSNAEGVVVELKSSGVGTTPKGI